MSVRREVNKMAHSPVEIMGYHISVNHKADRTCEKGCGKSIPLGVNYVRVKRHDGSIEIFDVDCFREEFEVKDPRLVS